jgi:hypothetical protein
VMRRRTPKVSPSSYERAQYRPVTVFWPTRERDRRRGEEEEEEWKRKRKSGKEEEEEVQQSQPQLRLGHREERQTETGKDRETAPEKEPPAESMTGMGSLAKEQHIMGWSMTERQGGQTDRQRQTDKVRQTETQRDRT